jgi:hypothetical protein
MPPHQDQFIDRRKNVTGERQRIRIGIDVLLRGRILKRWDGRTAVMNDVVSPLAAAGRIERHPEN